MGEHRINRDNWDWRKSTTIRSSAPTRKAVPVWEDYLDAIRKAGSSVGAVIEVVAENVPAGLGAPIYAKLDQDICANLMSINAVKGVEIGNGFEAARISGEQTPTRCASAPTATPIFLSNNAGGILGRHFDRAAGCGAVRSQADILDPERPARSITPDGNEVDVRTKGRHDPCVGIRAVPIGEAMVACASPTII
jgi:chorismate synthase